MSIIYRRESSFRIIDRYEEETFLMMQVGIEVYIVTHIPRENFYRMIESSIKCLHVQEVPVSDLNAPHNQ